MTAQPYSPSRDPARPVLVCVPGTMCSPAVFRRLAERIGNDADVDLVSWMTRPGPWDIPTLAAGLVRHVTERSFAGPVILVGHSTGGAIVLQAAAERPELAAGLVLANTGANMHGHGDVDAIISRLDSHWGPQLHAAVLDRSFSLPLDPEFRQELLGYVAGVPKEAALEALVSQRDLDLTGRLPGVRAPAVVVHGVKDQARTPAHARALAAGLPWCELRWAETGHCPMWEDPERFADAVRDLAGRS